MLRRRRRKRRKWSTAFLRVRMSISTHAMCKGDMAHEADAHVFGASVDGFAAGDKIHTTVCLA